jgi:hypothetical protein
MITISLQRSRNGHCLPSHTTTFAGLMNSAYREAERSPSVSRINPSLLSVRCPFPRPQNNSTISASRGHSVAPHFRKPFSKFAHFLLRCLKSQVCCFPGIRAGHIRLNANLHSRFTAYILCQSSAVGNLRFQEINFEHDLPLSRLTQVKSRNKMK